jgi:DNA replication ATP-dependent helicase Dna2
LRDWRRINVSFTRAKKKLVIFGSATTMGSDKLLKSFLDLMEEKDWMLRLKAGAEKAHSLPVEGATAERPGRGGDDKEVKVKREVKVEKGILNGRPFLKEALDVSQLVVVWSLADQQAE